MYAFKTSVKILKDGNTWQTEAWAREQPSIKRIFRNTTWGRGIDSSGSDESLQVGEKARESSSE